MLRRLYVIIMYVLCHNMRDASPAPDYLRLLNIYQWIRLLLHARTTQHKADISYQPAQPSHCDLRPVLAFRGVVLRRKRWAAIVNRK